MFRDNWLDYCFSNDVFNTESLRPQVCLGVCSKYDVIAVLVEVHYECAQPHSHGSVHSIFFFYFPHNLRVSG